MAVLSLPTNNALEPTSCRPRRRPRRPRLRGRHRRSGTARSTVRPRCGRSPRSACTTTPPGRRSEVRRTLVAQGPVIPTNTQTNNNPAWNYIYADATGSTCDVTLNNNVSGSPVSTSPATSAWTTTWTSRPSRYRRGKPRSREQRRILASSGTRVETYVGGNCRYGGGSWASRAPGTRTVATSSRKLMPAGSVGRQQRRTRHSGARRRLRRLVRERDAWARAELHGVERDATHVRQQLPVPEQQPRHVRADPGDARTRAGSAPAPTRRSPAP